MHRPRPAALLLLMLAACGETAPPVQRTIAIGPASPTTVDDLVATADLSVSDDAFYRIGWWVDGVRDQTLDGARVPAVRTRRGQRFEARLLAFGLGQPERTVASDAVIIGNAIPRITRALLVPGQPRSDDAVRVQIGGPADADGDQAEVRYLWYADGALISEAASLPPGALSAGQQLELVVYADDGLDAGPELRVGPVQVRPPFDEEPRWALGPDSTCFERAAGVVWCWGFGFTTSVLDQGPPTQPVAVSHAMVPRALASAQQTHLAIDRDGVVWRWGRTTLTGPSQPVAERLEVPSGAAAVDVAAAGALLGCVVDDEGGTWCYGEDERGALGPSTPRSLDSLTRVLDGVALRRLSIGGAHGCGIDRDDTIWCFGLNARGSLGDPDLDNGLFDPVSAALPAGWRAVSAGFNHACALDAERGAWCWGNNVFGALGTRLGPSDEGPGRVAGGERWLQVGAGQRFTCGLRDDQTLWCWGDNGDGALGRSAPALSEVGVEVQVGSGTAWATIGVGPTHACGERDDGSLWCWGRNGAGQLGDGSLDDSVTPVRVILP